MASLVLGKVIDGAGAAVAGAAVMYGAMSISEQLSNVCFNEADLKLFGSAEELAPAGIARVEVVVQALATLPERLQPFDDNHAVTQLLRTGKCGPSLQQRRNATTSSFTAAKEKAPLCNIRSLAIEALDLELPTVGIRVLYEALLEIANRLISSTNEEDLDAVTRFLVSIHIKNDGKHLLLGPRPKLFPGKFDELAFNICKSLDTICDLLEEQKEILQSQSHASRCENALKDVLSYHWFISQRLPLFVCLLGRAPRVSQSEFCSMLVKRDFKALSSTLGHIGRIFLCTNTMHSLRCTEKCTCPINVPKESPEVVWSLSEIQLVARVLEKDKLDLNSAELTEAIHVYRGYLAKTFESQIRKGGPSQEEVEPEVKSLSFISDLIGLMQTVTIFSHLFRMFLLVEQIRVERGSTGLACIAASVSCIALPFLEYHVKLVEDSTKLLGRLNECVTINSGSKFRNTLDTAKQLFRSEIQPQLKRLVAAVKILDVECSSLQLQHELNNSAVHLAQLQELIADHNIDHPDLVVSLVHSLGGYDTSLARIRANTVQNQSQSSSQTQSDVHQQQAEQIRVLQQHLQQQLTDSAELDLDSNETCTESSSLLLTTPASTAPVVQSLLNFEVVLTGPYAKKYFCCQVADYKPDHPNLPTEDTPTADCRAQIAERVSLNNARKVFVNVSVVPEELIDKTDSEFARSQMILYVAKKSDLDRAGKQCNTLASRYPELLCPPAIILLDAAEELGLNKSTACSKIDFNSAKSQLTQLVQGWQVTKDKQPIEPDLFLFDSHSTIAKYEQSGAHPANIKLFRDCLLNETIATTRTIYNHIVVAANETLALNDREYNNLLRLTWEWSYSHKESAYFKKTLIYASPLVALAMWLPGMAAWGGGVAVKILGITVGAVPAVVGLAVLTAIGHSAVVYNRYTEAQPAKIACQHLYAKTSSYTSAGLSCCITGGCKFTWTLPEYGKCVYPECGATACLDCIQASGAILIAQSTPSTTPSTAPSTDPSTTPEDFTTTATTTTATTTTTEDVKSTVKEGPSSTLSDTPDQSTTTTTTTTTTASLYNVPPSTAVVIDPLKLNDSI